MIGLRRIRRGNNAAPLDERGRGPVAQARAGGIVDISAGGEQALAQPGAAGQGAGWIDAHVVDDLRTGRRAQ